MIADVVYNDDLWHIYEEESFVDSLFSTSAALPYLLRKPSIKIAKINFSLHLVPGVESIDLVLEGRIATSSDNLYFHRYYA